MSDLIQGILTGVGLAVYGIFGALVYNVLIAQREDEDWEADFMDDDIGIVLCSVAWPVAAMGYWMVQRGRIRLNRSKRLRAENEELLRKEGLA